MRRALYSTAAVILTGSLFVAAPADAGNRHQSKAKPVNTSKLTKAVTVNNQLKTLRQLQVIANRNDGNRASGLPGYDASADYVASQLKKAGYKVKRQTFTFAFSRDLAPAELQQVTPTARDIETAAFDYSGSGDVTGTITPIGLVIPPGEAGSTASGCEVADFPPAGAEPAVALMQRGFCNFGVKAANAEAAGYDAAIIFNEGQDGRQELLTGTLGEPVGIPVVGTSYDDGVALAEQDGATVRVFASTEVDLNRETSNVIADLPGKTKNSDQVVVVGAHLDSVAEGPGINDNGSGTAAVLEIAKQYTKTKLAKKAQRPVRFAFWGAEEKGLLGAEHYVANLTDAQRAKIYANLNFDMIGSPNFARFVYDGDGSDGDAGPAGSAEIEKVFTDYFAGRRLATAPTAFDGRSDYGPFIAAGIPAGGLFSGAEGIKTPEEATLFGGTAGVAYDVCYHQACDDITNINTRALDQLGDAAAHSVGVLALSKQGLYGDQRRAKASAKKLAAAAARGNGHALTH
ncbi:M20/M25/M40 family metallo-hydrolase [Aeromicrobium wangtongii]|uniref:M20/M25/M40 family metallo-hydrolase n=1 Tax=Aeromicrobium wangtongii TaxID=2969247 RepID=A0ABY5M1L6_9ACTN|nr:M20/M25/M40 family metallo-hydrolase [Aeromicrobium wangtongii]MCD9198058.1 M20/M25/M40 family metallo-hydrolase [Aeromicrobium wangtongii]UUP12098.1 M20/M25/M40 family metallo-hydrolase [Aeromicrobium wangtongii]